MPGPIFVREIPEADLSAAPSPRHQVLLRLSHRYKCPACSRALTMDVHCQFPNVHWIWKGGISFVYEVHPRIVVKVPKPGEFERQQFSRELKIYGILSRHPPCPSLVQCFLYTENGIFLEYMRDMSLASRIQSNHIRDPKTGIITEVKRLEAPALRKKWMNELAQAVAFLESLNLAHGDLRPENVLLDRDQLKLSDFDCTAEIGTDFEACVAPYGRLLNNDDEEYGRCGTSGSLGPRTEQFALGSLYYLINYGFEVYANQCLTDDPREHWAKVVDLLQDMVFPKLDSDPLIDDIIEKCWKNRFATVAEVAARTRMLLSETEEMGYIMGNSISWRMIMTSFIQKLLLSFGYWKSRLKQILSGHMNRNQSAESFDSKRAICEDLKKRGLLSLLASHEPGELGFT